MSKLGGGVVSFLVLVRCIGGAGIKHGPDGMQIALDNRQSRIGGDEPGLHTRILWTVRYYHSHRDPDPVYTLFDGVADADLGFSPALEHAVTHNYGDGGGLFVIVHFFVVESCTCSGGHSLRT